MPNPLRHSGGGSQVGPSPDLLLQQQETRDDAHQNRIAPVTNSGGQIFPDGVAQTRVPPEQGRLLHNQSESNGPLMGNDVAVGAGSDVEQIPDGAWRALAIGAAGYVLVGFNTTATNIAFDEIGLSFPTVSETTTAFVASGYLIGTAAFLPIGGRVADRLGRVKIFQAGMAIFALSGVLSAVAPTIWVLIAARILQALAGALVIPASLSMVLPLFPAARRPSAVAAWAAAGPLAAAIAPSASAAVLQVSSWRWLYFVTAPIAVGVFLLGWRVLREVAPPQADGKLDLLGTALGTAGIALIVFGVGKGKDWGWASALTVSSFVVAVLAIIAFLWQSRRHPEPLIDLDLFRRREVWMTNAANTFISLTSLAIWLVWPLYLKRIWGYSNFEMGLALTAGPIAAATMTLAGGRVADRFGHRWPIHIGSLIMVFAVGWCWLVLSPDGSYVTSFLPGIAGFGFGWGFSSPTMNSYALEAVPEATWGAMNAAFNMLRNVAGAIGIAAAVAFVGSADRPDIIAAFDRAFLFFFVSNVIGALLIFLFYPRRSERSAVATRTSG